MITRASHCVRSAFLTSSRAWFSCSEAHERWERGRKNNTHTHTQRNVAKCLTSWQNKNKGKGKRKRHAPFIANLRGRIREIRQKRDSISPPSGQTYHISPSSGYSRAPRQLSWPANICDRQHVCTCTQPSVRCMSMCMCPCVRVCVRVQMLVNAPAEDWAVCSA